MSVQTIINHGNQCITITINAGEIRFVYIIYESLCAEPTAEFKKAVAKYFLCQTDFLTISVMNEQCQQNGIDFGLLAIGYDLAILDGDNLCTLLLAAEKIPTINLLPQTDTNRFFMCVKSVHVPG